MRDPDVIAKLVNDMLLVAALSDTAYNAANLQPAEFAPASALECQSTADLHITSRSRHQRCKM